MHFVRDAVILVVVFYAIHKHLTVAAVKSELTKIETEAVTDAKAVIARIKNVL